MSDAAAFACFLFGHKGREPVVIVSSEIRDVGSAADNGIDHIVVSKLRKATVAEIADGRAYWLLCAGCGQKLIHI